MVFPSKSPADDFEQRISAREQRLIAVVEAYLRQLRSGGAADPETHLRQFEELRQDLEPLLQAVLRLEASALWIVMNPKDLHKLIEDQILTTCDVLYIP